MCDETEPLPRRDADSSARSWASRRLLRLGGRKSSRAAKAHQPARGFLTRNQKDRQAHRSADFPVCRFAGFLTRWPWKSSNARFDPGIQPTGKSAIRQVRKPALLTRSGPGFRVRGIGGVNFARTALAAAALVFALDGGSAWGAGNDRTMKRPLMSSATRTNQFYPGNRAPLLPSPFVKLPIGAIRPEGWLREQLRLMADGFTGHLPEVSPWCRFEGSAWTSPTGEGKFGWEELPYWLKGFTDLGFILGDNRITADAKQWIDGIIQSQQPNGYFGSKTNFQTLDIWPNMVALYPIRTYYEATGDPKVLNFMTKYFRWLASVPREKLLPGSWQKIRGGDNLESIYWLYNRTGEAWLLDVARVNHERTADWSGGIPTWHGVNLTQGFREPAEYWQQAREPQFLHATLRNYDTIMRKYGQVPGGMFGADENAREGYTGPRQAAETCSMVEFMYSDEMLLGITGDATWGDRCEEIAFNSLPASMTPDLKGLHYLTAPNLVQLDRTNKAPMVENDGDMFSFNPFSYRCCQHNVAFGWPYFSEHLWMAAPGNGLAATLYAACEVKAKAGDGADVAIKETTDYPFDDQIHFALSSARPVQFPLLLRVPGWCPEPQVRINGRSEASPRSRDGWITLNRLWRPGDQVTLTLPMSIEVKVWSENKNAVSVNRGPLTYSLAIGERWQRYGGTDRWPAFEVFPTTPWNFGLLLDPQDPADSIRLLLQKRAIAPQPFTPENAPVTLRAKGKRIPDWKQEANGLVAEIPPSPVRSSEPAEDITLIPMGCARLRITAFPQVTEMAKKPR